MDYPVWEEIVQIEFIEEDQYPYKYVYDIGVDAPENLNNGTFALQNGIFVHNTLNRFHYCGVSSQMTQGVPRIRELISVSKKIKTPSMRIYLNNNNKELARQLAHNIQMINFDFFIDNTSIWYDPDVYNSRILTDKQFMRDYYTDFHDYDEIMQTLSPWVLRIEIHPLFFANKNLTMFDIYYFLLQKFEKKLNQLHIIYTDEIAEHTVIHIRFIHKNINSIKSISISMNSSHKNISNSSDIPSNSSDIPSNTSDIPLNSSEIPSNSSDLPSIPSNTLSNTLSNTSSIPCTNDDYSLLLNIEQDLTSNCLFKGMDQIEKVILSETKSIENNQKGNENNTVIHTIGTNLQEILQYNNPIIDKYRTISNDIHEVYNILGIEAARELLRLEICEVLNQSCVLVNDAHVSLLVDSMTLNGGLISMNRYGISKVDNGIFAMASFEEPDDHFAMAAVYNKKDNMQGISSNIFLGQIANFGTGITELVFDLEKFNQYTK